VSLSGYTFIGESAAWVGTAMAVKELRLCFDLGHLEPAVLSAENVFISHGHTDHCGELLNFLAVRTLEHRPMATLFIPPAMARPLTRVLSDWQEMSRTRFDFRLVQVHPNAPVPLRQGLTVTALALDHQPETFGFLVEESVQKLKEEYKNLPTAELVRRKAGPDRDLFYTLVRPLVAYIPDTLPEALDRLPDQVWKARVLALEASFLDQRKPMEKVRLGRHLHLDDVAARLMRFRGEHLLLFHFSRLYSPEEIPTLVRAGLPPEQASRVHCFL